MSVHLAFGLRDIPADVTTAWGARWIWPNDMIYNRQDLKGPGTDKLIQWLNSGTIAAARVAALDLIQIGLRPDEDREVVLYEDGDGIIKANPQASHGYLYVAAWLKGEI